MAKRITIFAGHYGSGKTNLAVNYALQLRRAGERVKIADLDIVNPYFRTKDSAKELEEAVIIDGGNHWQIYWKIVLPLSKPALGTFAILAYSNVWDEFLIALTMIKTPDKRTLPIALRLFQGQNLNNWGVIFAASLIAVLPILIIYIIMQKKLIHGGAMDGMLKG